HFDISICRTIELSIKQQNNKRKEPAPHLITAITQMDLLWSFLLFSLYFPAFPHFLQRCFRGFTFALDKYGNGLHNSLFAE
ncbi:hypothetical protein HMPREF0658_0499, partial [Hoylesella marshii DSM 16973 = JCM 13450]